MPPILPPQTLKSILMTLSKPAGFSRSHSAWGGFPWPQATSTGSEFTKLRPVQLSYISRSDFKGSHAGRFNNDRLSWPKNRKQFNTVHSGQDRQIKHQILALYKIQASQRYFCLFAFLMWLGSSQIADSRLSGACKMTVMLLKASLPYLTS